jgi:hypothetical protein
MSSTSDSSISSGGDASTSFNDSILATSSDEEEDQKHRKMRLHFLLIARIRNRNSERLKKFAPLRLNWAEYVIQLIQQNEFGVTFKISLLSFNTFVETLRVKLEVDVDQAQRYALQEECPCFTIAIGN